MLWNMISNCGVSASQGHRCHGFIMDSWMEAEVGVPMRPWEISVCIARMTGLQRYCWLTASFTPAASASPTISAASAKTFESGFWHSRCLPPPMRVRARASWCHGGTATSTMSTESSPTTSFSDANTRPMPHRSAVLRAVSTLTSKHPTTFNPWAR